MPTENERVKLRLRHQSNISSDKVELAKSELQIISERTVNSVVAQVDRNLVEEAFWMFLPGYNIDL